MFSREENVPVQPVAAQPKPPGRSPPAPIAQPNTPHPTSSTKEKEIKLQRQLEAFEASLRKVNKNATTRTPLLPRHLLSASTAKAATTTEHEQRGTANQANTKASVQPAASVVVRNVGQAKAVLASGVVSSNTRATAQVTETKDRDGTISHVRTVLNAAEIDDLKHYHDSSLAENSKKAYQSDHDGFVAFLQERFPRMPAENIHTQCTLEHVLAYLNHLCNEGKKMSTINRHYATIRKHILPALFSKNLVPGSREEETMREVERIVRGMRRTVGAENRIRGKKPLLIEHIRKMVDRAAEATDDDGAAMPNKRCRDVSLLLFMFFSAMRRSEIAALLWSDLTFDRRGVVVLTRKSKTDQECKSQPIALSRLENEYCPVVALEKWKAKSAGDDDSPVFRWISKKDEIQWRVLIDQRIVALIKDYCEQIGLDPTGFAAHSTRSGYVTSSSERGVPISEMMKRTRHKAVSSLQVYMKSDDLFQGAGDRRL